MCANCGNATSESLPVAKVFRRVDESGKSASDRFAIARASVPFCPPCTARHQHEVRVTTPAQRFGMLWRGRNSRSGLGLGGIALLIVFMATRSVSGSWLMWGIAAFFAGLSALCIWAGYYETEYLAIPPPTSVTSAFDLTDNRAGLLEREHRTLFLRNPLFAEAFRARNTAQVWNPDDAAKRRAAKTRNLLVNVLAAAVALWLVWMILRSFR